MARGIRLFGAARVTNELGATLSKIPTGADPQSGTARMRVLLADDDESVARSIARVLRAEGFEVVIASSGNDAANSLTQQSFDVVVSDIHMPDLTGVELLGLVRRHDLDVPVILMTGDPNIETAIQAVELGALKYLRKPIEIAPLKEALGRAARLHRLARTKREALELLGAPHSAPGDRVGLERTFDNALRSMWVAFQPIISSSQQTIFGYEALMRSAEPSLPHPGAVLEAAERLGRLHDVGRTIRDRAAEAFNTAPADALLFINLHTRDLLDPELYEKTTPLASLSDRVILEITERASIDDVPDVLSRARSLRDLGYRLAVDDLGAGYAGLSSFARLEPDLVKLDMTLIRKVHTSPVQQKLIASMTALCQQLGLHVVAEGIEEADERDKLASLGCDLMQGYFFAKPGEAFPRVNFG